MNLSNATVAQVMLPVEDLDQGISFYRDILGIPFIFAAQPNMAFFMCGSVRLLVGVLPEGRKPERGSAIYFRVPDIQAVYSYLKARGVQFMASPHLVNRSPKSELWLAEFTDPDGNQLALMAEVPVGST